MEIDRADSGYRLRTRGMQSCAEHLFQSLLELFNTTLAPAVLALLQEVHMGDSTAGIREAMYNCLCLGMHGDRLWAPAFGL
jgi:hypothetical protein